MGFEQFWWGMAWRKAVATVLLLAGPGVAWAAHGYALWGELKYPPAFTHFNYVNPDAVFKEFS